MGLLNHQTLLMNLLMNLQTDTPVAEADPSTSQLESTCIIDPITMPLEMIVDVDDTVVKETDLSVRVQRVTSTLPKPKPKTRGGKRVADQDTVPMPAVSVSLDPRR